MRALTRFSMKNAAVLFIFIICLSAGGVYSISKMNMEKYPAVDIPFLDILIVYPGASPDQALEDIGKQFEEALRNVKNIDNLFVGAGANALSATVQFSMSADAAVGEQEVRKAISGLELPEGAHQPEFKAFKLDPEIYSLAIYGGTEQSLRDFVEIKLDPDLTAIRGIENVKVQGIADLFVDIKVKPEALDIYHLTLEQLRSLLLANHLSIPIGELDTTEQILPIRLDSTFKSADEVAKFPIGLRNPDTSDGMPLKIVKLSELAEVSTQADSDQIIQFNGQPAIQIDITPVPGQDAVTIAKKVKNVLQNTSFPEGIQYQPLLDRSLEIEKSVSAMMREVLFGVIMAVLVTLLFLRNLRSTLIAVISIPLSMFASFIILSNLGYTLNTLTLAAIAVAVGRVVDDSIVVMENIFRRVSMSDNDLRDGKLIENATSEVARAITSSTMTTVAVFLPLAFVPGIVGKFFVPLAWTIVISLLFSLLVAVTVVPLLSNMFLLRIKHKESKENAVQRVYLRTLRWALSHRLFTILIAIALLGGSGALVPFMGFNFIPSETTHLYRTNITMPVGSSLSNTEKIVAKTEELLHSRKDIEYVHTQISNESAQIAFQINEEITQPEQIISSLREDFLKLKEVKTIVIMGVSGMDVNGKLSLIVNGPNLDEIKKGAEQMVTALNGLPGLTDVHSTADGEKPEIRIHFNPQKLAENGLTAGTVAMALKNTVEGQNIAEISSNGTTTSIRLSMLLNGEQSIDKLKEQKVTNMLGQPVPFKEIGTLELVNNPIKISHLNQQAYLRLNATITDSNTGKVVSDAESILNSLNLPKDVTWSSEGVSKEMKQGFVNSGIAIAVSIVLVLVVMLISFGEWKVPVIILVAIPFSFIGSILGLFILGEEIGIAAMIGLLMLNGIVVTNAIVLLDRVKRNRMQGQGIQESLLEAGKTRIRPILMTAIATIGALIPLAISTESGLISRALAIVVIGGLTTSTLLTLIIVPVLYSFFDGRLKQPAQQDATIRTPSS
ncbi:HAE1 family hydrophobic/amphiphilic exporter-1 [Paenibacillus sp. DS2015]|uniref:efflux RND transporter permease subunit n=1 Tax=Paenibacillus sp. DS2015 TaxID=3373917 RepID=UPI003D19A4F0